MRTISRFDAEIRTKQPQYSVMRLRLFKNLDLWSTTNYVIYLCKGSTVDSKICVQGSELVSSKKYGKWNGIDSSFLLLKMALIASDVGQLIDSLWTVNYLCKGIVRLIRGRAKGVINATELCNYTLASLSRSSSRRFYHFLNVHNFTAHPATFF